MWNIIQQGILLFGSIGSAVGGIVALLNLLKDKKKK